MLEVKEIEEKMKELAKKLNYEYENIKYLKEAMHCQKKANNGDGENRKNYTNSAISTLGDSVLKMILTEYFYDSCDDAGKITDKRKEEENNKKLFDLCIELEIYRFAYKDKYFYDDSPKNDRVARPKHDIYIEAIIGAIYKDKGLEYCKKWTIEFLQNNNKLEEIL